MPPRPMSAWRRASSGAMPARMLSSMCATRWPFNSSARSKSRRRRPNNPASREMNSCIAALITPLELLEPLEPLLPLFLPERDHGIHASRRTCRQVAGDERDGADQPDDSGDRDRIGRPDAEQQRGNEAPGGEGDDQAGGDARQ